jgi:hypothetical protein
MRYAVVPSNGRACLTDCIHKIYDQVDRIIVIDTGEAWCRLEPGDPKIWRMACDTPNNISHWWNEGIYLAEHFQMYHMIEGPWEVGIINDDALVPPDWFANVAGHMRDVDAVAGCSGGHDVIQTEAVAVPLDQRMEGFAFILAGEHGLHANEKLHWYFSDDYIDWEARKGGGMAMFKGSRVEHLYPNRQLSSALAAQTAVDAQTFVDIYGRRPW